MGVIPGLDIIIKCGLSLLVVLVLALRVFLWVLWFPFSSKSTFLNSNLIWEVSPINVLG